MNRLALAWIGYTDQSTARGVYILESADKIYFFAELTALSTDSSGLLPEYQTNNMQALNKAGHALHLTPGAFSTNCRSSKIRDSVTDLGWKDPVV
jgi:hypothetical protein